MCRGSDWSSSGGGGGGGDSSSVPVDVGLDIEVSA